MTELRTNAIPTQAPVHDPRVTAMVIADPAFAPLFDRDGLKDIKIPVQLWASEHSDEDGITEIRSGYVATMDQELAIKPDYHIVRNAGYFVFRSPCSPDLAKKLPKICDDRPGFDRATFHQEFNADVLAFSARIWSKPISLEPLFQRTRKTSLPRKWRDSLTLCAATASLSR